MRRAEEMFASALDLPLLYHDYLYDIENKDTVRTILGTELVQNYSKLFGESPSAEAVGEWTENLRTFFPIRVGRFLVYKTITQGEKKVETYINLYPSRTTIRRK